MRVTGLSSEQREQRRVIRQHGVFNMGTEGGHLVGGGRRMQDAHAQAGERRGGALHDTQHLKR